MARIVIAGASESGRTQLSRLLASSGHKVYRCCASGSDLRRTVNEIDDGVVILIGSLPGCDPDELQWDLGDRVQILLIGKPAVLEACEAPEIFRLALPASGQAVLGAVEMLTQLHRMRLPRRSGAGRALVDRAKEILMAKDRLTEPQAHRAMQRYAMDHGMRMEDYAEIIVKGDGGKEYAGPGVPPVS